MLSQCKLCLRTEKLRRSHIIPVFVINWLKTSSPEYIRSNLNPNLRREDGYKHYLFCEDCEQLLSGWEKSFKEQIFVPFQSDLQRQYSMTYGTWMLKFAVSISLRVLLYCTKLGLPPLIAKQQKSITEASETWRKFLLEEIETPQRFEQHLLLMNIVDDTRLFNDSQYLNRYLLSTIDLDLVIWESSIFVYAKLGRLLLFGLIEDKYRNQWMGTKLDVEKGIIKEPANYTVSANILNYIGEKANQTATIALKISPRQLDKVSQMVEENLDKVATSEFVRGLIHDIASQKQIRPNFDGSEEEK